MNCVLRVYLELTIISDRVSATQVVHFAHDSTSTYLTNIEVELYGTFFYNQFSSGNNNSF